MKMAKTELEYIWLDGDKPIQCLSGKTKIVKGFTLIRLTLVPV